jgi:CDP-diacylglycerol--serine O-phosphatidyltransferase
MQANAMTTEARTAAGGKGGISSFLSIQDIFSLLNAAGGLLCVFFSIRGNFFIAVLFLPLCVVCDYLDGKIGRWIGTPHEFGKELDSLSDVIGFGIAPAVFAYTYAAQDVWLTLVLVIFVLCGILRLARFNVINLKGVYIGTPITLNGLIVPLIYFAMLPTRYYAMIFLLSAAFMISPLRIKKLV